MKNSRNPKTSPSTLPDAILFRRDGSYWMTLENHPGAVKFVVPTTRDVLKTCKCTSRKPPTIYIIFRNPVQSCLRDLNRKYDRKDVSRISSRLWKNVKKNQPHLREEFKKL